MPYDSLLCHVCKTIHFEKLISDEIDEHINLGALISISKKQKELLPPDHVDFETIKSWISTCVSSHTSVEEFTGCGTRKWETTQIKLNNLKVVDVWNECIVTLPKGKPYVALSYVWGQVPTLLATKENQDALSRPGGLSRATRKNPIAKTILEAIILTRNVDLHYIWVDSLCIVQDDDAEKTRLINEMAVVYLAAHFTIIAATGNSGESGLPGVQPTSRIVKQDIARVSPKLSLLLQGVSETNLDSSTWNTRGWTFQERLFSKRLLIFLPDRIYWQCRSVIWNEDVVHEHPAALDNEMMDFRTRLRFLNTNTDRAPKLSIGLLPNGQAFLFRHPARDEYDWAVLEYTRRRLTYLDDIERAFAGILNVLQLGLGDFLCGLPTSYLDATIIWYPNEALVRRKSLATKFPTWSWMGWIGSVGFSAQFRSLRSMQEHSRPLIYWYKVESNGTLTRLRQVWEDLLDRSIQSQLFVEEWKPLTQPEDMNFNLPSLESSFKLSYGSSVHLAFRSCMATFSVRTSKPTTMDISSLTYDIYSEELWIGRATFHGSLSVRSRVDFVVLSEVEISGVPELDKGRLLDAPCNFFNVLAIDPNDKSQILDQKYSTRHDNETLLIYRCGLGVISKSAWAQVDTRWTNFILG
ncbi:MAG: hypothetical protein LQ342_004312 [Letrouitia transgressa]|nr:MAG: hypothetical protein LQ342_004312 [Letrouitia transgressa]